MKRNENLVLIGERVALVPYRPEHVPKYHEWMKSPFLLEMTASEPLTLEEEYQMQESWQNDENKLTFIITTLPGDNTGSLRDIPTNEIKDNTVMIGDVNIFFNDPDNDTTFGEIEIMIAEPDYRKMHRGKEALQMIMGYAIKDLGLKTFHAKISQKNDASIDFFKSKFCYYEVSFSNAFKEFCFEWTLLEPLPPKVDEYGDEIESYGSKTTLKQRENVLNVFKEIEDFYRNVISGKYEKSQE